ncbi:hypothetical protein NECAME_10341 [Necator americanus]|uniref:G-protein coupled receptors family 3 profile domain-containing protein n=1 Tax=Necator americanus TaxID=51031 RepID=W2T982_NECAM|nr:hypothetical protein NECAME_10341 [Necator americanus]ETN78418.1 hypothetical protein NECAME_10341 [Necator americanus]
MRIRRQTCRGTRSTATGGDDWLESMRCGWRGGRLLQLLLNLLVVVLVQLIVVSSAEDSLSQLLSRLDDSHTCGRAISAGRLLSTAINARFPRLIPLARFFAEHPGDFDATFLENSSFDLRPPLKANLSGYNPLYALEYSCENATTRWLPTIVFPTKDPNATSRRAYLTLRMEFDVDLCNSVPCNTKCTWTVHGGLRVLAKTCCNNGEDLALCRTDPDRNRPMLLVANAACAIACLALIPVVCRARRRGQEARGWALMELFLIGASILYMINEKKASKEGGELEIPLLQPEKEVRIEDSFVFHVFFCAGLMAWTVGSWGDTALWKTAWPQCRMQGWHVIWHCYELLFLLYGMRLCYKARNSDWLERWQFTVAVCLEAVITLMANLIRYSIRNSGHSDTLFTISFVQLQLTVSVNIVIIIAPKFYLVSGESTRRSMTLGGHSGRAHPSLAKLRDNILNGTIDFAEVPIADMNPEDIRAELKRVYTQLRMYKLKNLYQDNPHISKKRGGKKWSDKTGKTRRISMPGCSPQGTKPRIEEDEKSDLTVESAPHNVYLSTYKLQLEPNHSVRV